MSVELPKAFPTFLLVVSLALFYLVYTYREDVFLKYFGVGFGVLLIAIAVILWYWDRKEYWSRETVRL